MFRNAFLAITLVASCVMMVELSQQAHAQSTNVNCPHSLYPCGLPTPGGSTAIGVPTVIPSCPAANYPCGLPTPVTPPPPSPCASSAVNGGCNTNNLNGDEGKSNASAMVTSPALNIASTPIPLVTGSTTVPKIIWEIGILGNSGAGAGGELEVGQATTGNCDTLCVPWSGFVSLSSTAGNTTCMWGIPSPPGAFGACGIGSGGIPLPATNPTTNLYLLTNATAPTPTPHAYMYVTNAY